MRNIIQSPTPVRLPLFHNLDTGTLFKLDMSSDVVYLKTDQQRYVHLGTGAIFSPTSIDKPVYPIPGKQEISLSSGYGL